MKCIDCLWGTRINEKVIFCIIPGDGCWKNVEDSPKSKRTKKKPNEKQKKLNN